MKDMFKLYLNLHFGECNTDWYN